MHMLAETNGQITDIFERTDLYGKKNVLSSPKTVRLSMKLHELKKKKTGKSSFQT